MKSLLSKIKIEKEKKKNFDKIKELEINLVKIKYVKNPNLVESKLKELNKLHAVLKIYTKFKTKFCEIKRLKLKWLVD